MKHSDIPPAVPNFVGFLHSSGYCEICDKEFRHINAVICYIFFIYYTQHIKTRAHVTHAFDSTLYSEIDNVIKIGFMNEKLESMVIIFYFLYVLGT